MPELDEDILRRLMLRSTDDLFAPPAAVAGAIRRQRRHRMRTRVLGVAGTAAAAGLAVGTLASTSGTGAHPAPAGPGASSTSKAAPIRLTAAQRSLFGLSAAAAKTPRPSGRYVVLTETASTIDSGSGGDSSEIGPKTSVIDTVTGGGLTYQDVTVSGSGSAGTPTPPAVLTAAPGTSPTVAQLDAMPTDPAKLRAVLLAQAKYQLAQANQMFAGKRKKFEKQLKNITPPQPTDDDLVYEQAANLLWEPDLSPALRSAVYKVLAATPGVIVKTDATDSSGRPAIEISRQDTVYKTNVETFEKLATGATLESAWISPGETDEDLYKSITYTSTIPADPYRG
jgi:hypothetical protein